MCEWEWGMGMGDVESVVRCRSWFRWVLRMTTHRIYLSFRINEFKN